MLYLASNVIGSGLLGEGDFSTINTKVLWTYFRVFFCSYCMEKSGLDILQSFLF